MIIKSLKIQILFNHIFFLLPIEPIEVYFFLKALPSMKLIYPLLLLLIIVSLNSQCMHDHFAHKSQKHFFNDLDDGRRLQETESGRLRIFVDYDRLTVGGATEINTIKRIVNITASYFYNTLNVTRLSRLYFPSGTSKLCNQFTVPDKYIDQGTIGDLGVLCGNEANPQKIYVAKSTACAHLKSNNRPIWGMIMFNNPCLKYDQVGFQQIIFVGIHQMTHILGFSAYMYELYPTGNPLIQETNGDYYLTSEILKKEVRSHYGCESVKGMLLEDQDGTLIGSHWQRKIVGNQYMIASNKLGSYVSRFTLALLESSGWYTGVNYTFAEPSTWGKNRGCKFFKIDDCDSGQFCTGTDFDCDWEGNSIGRCSSDLYSGSCNTIKYYTNTVCTDENFELKNLNAKLNTLERGGSNSKCFISNLRQAGMAANLLNNRCYVSVCSFSGKYLFILIGQTVNICRVAGQKIAAPSGMEGTLKCPRELKNYCKTKQNCPYHCNKNGACINGQCLCTGSKELSATCLDVSIYEAPIGSTGGFLNSRAQKKEKLQQTLNEVLEAQIEEKQTIIKYSINNKCLAGTVLDTVFGECLHCKDIFGCKNCDQSGCITCDNGDTPLAGKCLVR